MKKVFTFALLFSAFLFIDSVSASETKYVNPNGVLLSSEEIDFIRDLFYEGFEDVLTYKDYQNIFNYGLTTESEIEKVQNLEIMPFSTIHTTSNKSITITKACTNSNCFITIVANWINLPKTKSYDVIGAYFSNTTAITVPTTILNSTAGSASYSNNNIAVNGVGCSVKLPDNGNNIRITQYFYVQNRGTVYGSYQHARFNISLANSQRYSFANYGYGGVFNFDSAVSGYYDQMAGVYITL